MAGIPKAKSVIGWREAVLLPDLADIPINAKIDTGARTSALHAFDLTLTQEDGIDVVSFVLHPIQRSRRRSAPVRLPVHRTRIVRSSNGKSEARPTVMTTARLGQHRWKIEMTLTSRDTMGFRMLLGRSAVKKRFIIDPSGSYMLSEKAKRSEYL
jgi:hypothetical protein